MQNEKTSKNYLTISNVNDYIQDNLEQDICNFSANTFLKTGFRNIDQKNTFLPGLYVLGAISSLGKTTFAHQLADQIIQQNHPVLFFSLEQSKLELVTKSLSRIMALQDADTAKTSAEIRSCADISTINRAKKFYNRFSAYLSIAEGNFNTTIDEIKTCIDAYMDQSHEKTPVIMIDYLQIIKCRHTNDTCQSVEYCIQELKHIQEKYKCILIVVSAINRQNYLNTIDFSAFKNSGAIEYTADVVWGMQLHILSEASYDELWSINKKRESVVNAKSQTPREIQICVLKNRFGHSGGTYEFDYFPAYDYFAVSKKYWGRPNALKINRR